MTGGRLGSEGEQLLFCATYVSLAERAKELRGAVLGRGIMEDSFSNDFKMDYTDYVKEICLQYQ